MWQRSERGPSVRTQSVCARQPRPKTWPYTSKDETVFMRHPGLGAWLLCARSLVFRCGLCAGVRRPSGIYPGDGEAGKPSRK